MKRTAIVLACTVALALIRVPAATESGDPARRADALLEQMTLGEKVGQLNLDSNTFDVTDPPPPSRVEGACLLFPPDFGGGKSEAIRPEGSGRVPAVGTGTTTAPEEDADSSSRLVAFDRARRSRRTDSVDARSRRRCRS